MNTPVLDRHLLRVVLLGILLPYGLHLPGLAIHGSDWLSPYFDRWAGIALVFNALPIATLVLLRVLFPRQTRAFRWATGFVFSFLVLAHLLVYLGSSEWDMVVLMVVPLWAIAAALIGWIVGLIAGLVSRIPGV